jgi:hypothetical protein
MKRLLTILVSILISFCDLSAQEIKNREDEVGFACYIQGSTTKVVDKMSLLLQLMRYDAIAEHLYSKNYSEQYLTVIIIERLIKNGKFSINEKDQRRIEELKQSENLVPICSGCTYTENVPIHRLLADDMKLLPELWLKQHVGE